MSTRTAEDIDAAIDRIPGIPPGYQLDLIVIGYIKMLLARVPMKEREQLDWLEKLDVMSKSDLRLTPAVVAAVPALSEPSARIVEEAQRLNGEPEQRDVDGRIIEIPSRNADKLLTSSEVFSTLVRMNPGMLDACEMLYPRPHGDSTRSAA